MEEHLREDERRDETFGRLAQLLLKLCCYHDLAIGPAGSDERGHNPSPRRLDEHMRACPHEHSELQVLVLEFPGCAARITLNGDDLYATLYEPTEALLDDVHAIARAEGLFVWEHRAE